MFNTRTTENLLKLGKCSTISESKHTTEYIYKLNIKYRFQFLFLLVSHDF